MNPHARKLGVALALCAMAPASAWALVEGVAPAKVGNWRVFGAHAATGASLMAPGPYLAEINSVLLSSSTAEIADLPFDGDVVAAYLFWSGSLPRTSRGGTPDPPDRDVDFTTADGTFYDDLSVDSDFTGFGRCSTAAGLGGFYYCRRDVTDIVRAQGIGNINGIYTVGDVDADAGTLDAWDPQWVNAQAKYAGWSLVVVWDADTETVRRDVVLYDGFLRLDEVDATAGVHSFGIADFLVGSPALGKLTVFGLEGDRQLGVPPQDSTGCPTCYDFISFQRAGAAGATKLSNGTNPANNSFNSSWNGQASIDIDTYNLSGLIQTGDSSATITVGSGDGVVPTGDGESFFVGWVVMSVDTLTPKFRGVQTKKRVSPATASAGQRVYYTLDVVNEGSVAATSVVVQDTIPAGTVYVVGSTRVDGSPVADVGGTSPLVGGLTLGTIPTAFGGDNSRQVTFEVTVDPSACGGSVSNTATVDSSETEPITLGPVSTSIAVAALDPPTKAVTFLSPGPIGPGSAFRYTIEVDNPGAVELGGVSVTDTLPNAIRVDSVFTTSGSHQLSGDVLTVSDLRVPAYGSAMVMVLARVKTVTELLAIGIAESAIDGLVISNQASVAGGCTPPQLTDDPDVGGTQPTEFEVTYAPVLTTSSKTASDVNGGFLEPNDVVRFTITVVNTGNRASDIVVRDAIPAATHYVPGSTRVDGVPIADVGGTSALASGYSLGAVAFSGDNDRVITFEARVAGSAANGTTIQNTALLEVPAVPSAGHSVSSPAMQVKAAPELSTSSKTVADLTAPVGTYRPGDLVEYTITVANTGNRPATSVVVTDALPAELTFVSATGGGTLAGGTVTWAVGTLAPGANTVLKVQARLVSPLDDGTVVSNRASIGCAQLQPFETPPAQFTVTSGALLVVTKTDEHPAQLVRPGDAVTYRIVIRNDGDMAARDVVVSDAIDASLTNVAAPTGVVAAGGVTWSAASDARLAAILPGAGEAVELVLTASVRAPLPNGTTVSNQASVTAEGVTSVLSDDPDTSASNDPTTFDVSAQAVLTVTKAVADLSPSTPFKPGDRVRYTITLAAQGDAPIRDVTVTDPVDASLTSVAATGGTLAGGTITWSAATGSAGLARLDPGQTVQLAFEATIASSAVDGTVVSNQASAASADLASPVASDGDASQAGAQPTRFTVVSAPVLALTKTVALVGDDDADFNPGDRVRYTLRLSNTGTDPATQVQIVDPIDAALSVQDAGGAQLVGGSLRWTSAQASALASVAPGASIELTFTADLRTPLDDGTVVDNQAQATSAEITVPVASDDPGAPGASDPTRFTVEAFVELAESTKAVRDLMGDSLITRPLDELEYTIIVRNSGDGNAHDVIVRDPIPADLDVVVPANAQQVGGELVWSSATEPRLALVAPGQDVTLVFTAFVDALAPAGRVIANQASLSAAEQPLAVLTDDPATAALDDATRVTVSGDVDVGASTKTVVDLNGVPVSTARAGDVVRYLVEVENRGTQPATNVVVRDVVDASLTVTRLDAGTLTGNEITWSAASAPALASVEPGEAVLLVFEARLNTPLVDGQVIANQASVEAVELAEPVLTDADPSTLPKDPTIITAVAGPDVSASTKVFADPATGAAITTARAGDAVRVVITVRNDGTAAATDVRVTDALDSSRLTTIVVRDGGVLVNGVARWVIPSIPAGGSAVLRVDARLRDPVVAGPLDNQAFIGLGAPPSIPTDDPSRPGVADPTRLFIESEADLSVATKDVSNNPDRVVSPGGTLTYAIEVRNGGVGTAQSVVVSDVLDPRLTFQSASSGGTFDVGTRTVRWSLGNIGVGVTRSLTLTTQVATGLADGTTIDNQATVSAAGLADELTDDPRSAAEDAPTRVTVRAGPLFPIFEKTVVNLDELTPGMLRPGDRLQYMLRLRNDGDAAATNIEVRDVIDPLLLTDVEPVTPLYRDGDAVVFDESVDGALALLAPGGEVLLVFTAKVAAGVADGTSIANQATAGSDEIATPVASDDPATSAARDPTVVRVSYPQLVARKTVSAPAEPGPGDELVYAIEVENTGSFSASEVTVSDVLDALLVDADASGSGGSVSGGVVSWSAETGAAGLASLAPGASVTLGLRAEIAAAAADGAVITNQAQVACAGVAPVPSDWPQTATPLDPTLVTVVALPALELRKVVQTPNPDTRLVQPRDTLTYVIEVRNVGRGPATDVLVSDALDARLALVDAPGAVVDGQELRWSVASVAAGEALELIVTASVREGTADGARIGNQAKASVGGDEVSSDDPTTVEPSDPTFVEVVARPRLSRTVLVATDLNGGTLQPGDRVRYELRVVNDGTAPSHDTAVRLTMPVYTTYVPQSTTLNDEAVSDLDGGSLTGESAVVNGVSVRSPRAATPEGVLLPDDGLAPSDETARLSFEVRVDPRAVPGTAIVAQAAVRGDSGGALSDNPATPEVLGDPTILVVGGGAALAVVKEARLAVDVGGDGRVDAGDALEYVVTVVNGGDGPSLETLVVDEVPAGSSFQPGSIRIDGVALTDAADGDAASFSDGRVEAQLGSVAPSGVRRVTFIVDVGSVAALSNQARVLSGAHEWLSDGDPGTPGTQPTVTVVDHAAVLIDLGFSGVDIDGGVVAAGDRLRYVITAHNPAAIEVSDVTFTMALPAQLDLTRVTVVSDVAELASVIPPVWRLTRLGPDERIQIELEANVPPAAEPGLVLEAVANAETAEASFGAEPVRFIVGGGAGSSAVSGRIFRERGDRNGLYEPDIDEALGGFSVAVIPAAAAELAGRSSGAAGEAIRTVSSDARGEYRIVGLPPGRYVLRVMSPEGTQYAESEVLELGGGASAQDFAVDPSGIIYQEVEGAASPVAGARVFLVNAGTGADVPATDLFGGQQGQTTSGQGFYRFDVRASALPGRFFIRVEPPSPLLFFPSATRPPVGAAEDLPFGAPADPPSDGRIVESDVPDLAADTSYFLTFDLDVTTPNITNNHIPLDRLEQHIRVTKLANRRTVQVGEIVTYTVTVTNPLSFGIGIDDVALEGVRLADDLPPDVTFVEDSARSTFTLGGRTSDPQRLDVQQRSGHSVIFEPLPLPARSQVTVRYYGVVGVRASGEQINRARLLSAGGTLVSNVAAATVRVVQDPIFDQGTVLGRVFCDRDRDGVLGPDEDGLPGARVFLDTGYYADTDLEGKYHFRGVEPRRHLVKLDLNTVPPGSEPTTDVTRELLLTRGLLGKIDFGVQCAYETVAASARAGAAPTAARDEVSLAVDTRFPAVSLGGAAQALPIVDVVLTAADEQPRFDEPASLNLEGPRKLTWHVAAPAGVGIERWQISVFTPEGREVWRVEASGAPPPRVPWELTADSAVLEPGAQYLYRIAVLTTQGDLGEGRWRRLGYEVYAPGSAAQSGSEQLAMLRGQHFREGTDQPTPELEREVQRLWQEVQAKGPAPKLVFEVHSGGGGTRSANLLLTQRQALTMMKLFIAQGAPAEILRGIGKGDSEPLMPSISRKAMELNRRIVVKADAPPAVLQELGPVEYEGYVAVNGETREVSGNRYDETLSLAAGDAVVVDVRQASGKRVRLRREYPFQSGEGETKRSVRIPVEGSLRDGSLVVGGVSLGMPLWRSACAAQPASHAVKAGRVEPPVAFQVRSEAPVQSWLVRIFNPEGTVLTDIGGEGAPPEKISWDGSNVAGNAVAREGVYSYRCMLTDAGGSRFVSPMTTLELGARSGGESGGGAALYEKILTGPAYPGAEALGDAAVAALDAAAAAAQANPGARVEIEVHDDMEGGKLQAQIRTARLAEALTGYLKEHGVAAELIDAKAQGASRPIMPGTSKRAQTMNRRVLLRVVGPPPAPEPSKDDGENAAQRVRVAGTSLTVGEDGGFKGEVVVDHDATLVFDVAAGDGRSAILNIPTFEGKPVVSAAAQLPTAGAPPAESPPIGSMPASLSAARPVAAGNVGTAEGAESAASRADAPSGLAADGVDAVAGWSAALPPAEAPAGGAVAAAVDGLGAVDGVGLEPLVDTAGGAVEGPDAQSAPCVAQMPAEGSTLRGERLTVRGRASEGWTVRINEQPTVLDEGGRFAQTLTLDGEATVTIACTDASGAEARIVRHYQVPEHEWFLLAMADTAFGAGETIDGMNDDTLVDLTDEIYLHGRAVAYFKGRVKGSVLLENNPFSQVRVTAHLDTGKEEQPDLLRQLIDPERFYPVYGDATEEVQDVSSRAKIYVLVEADRSRLIVGNFQTAIQGLELFQYQRTFFGAALDLDHELVAGQRTEVHAFAASGEEGVRHRHLVLQGTGGSMFFLRDDDLLEGSEKVELVVRDEVTGARLMTLPQVRNVDYTVDHRDGRIVFSRPVPSVVDAGWRVDQNPARTLDGHPVFIEVEYDFLASSADDDDQQSFGLQARHTLFDRVTLGAGIVNEERDGANYQLVGGELRVRLLERTQLTAEVAFSQAVDADHLASFDGGLTYGRIGSPDRFRVGRENGWTPSSLRGWAGKLTAAGDVREIMDAVQGGSAAAVEPFLPYTLHVQHQDPQFFSGASILEQGQTKFGGTLRAILTPQDQLRLRHDGVWSELFFGEDRRTLNRQLSAVGYEHRFEQALVGAEVGHTYTSDGDRRGHRDTIAAYGEYRLTPRLTLSGEQELFTEWGVSDTAWPSERRADDWTDRLATTVGARYELAESLWLSATETVRWSGTNSTQVGLKAQLGESLSLYVSERLLAGAGRTMSTTVVGGESTGIPGSRSYAEYQLDALASGESGRAVIGMDNRWTLLEGLKLNLSFERAQVVGDRSELGFATGYSIADPGVTGAGSGPVARDQQFSASGYSSAGVFPTGVASRDAFAVGLDYVAASTFKAGTRFELRYDRGDERLLTPDRLTLYGQAGADWRFDRDFVLLGRTQGASVRNTSVDFTEGQFLDVSLGMALRPEDTDRYGGLLKWTRRYERRPVNERLTRFQLQISDVLALEPYAELGAGLQLVGKAAVKFYEVLDAELPRIRSTTLLTLARLNYHVASQLDAGAEYRWMTNFLADQSEHGALVEIAWVPVRYVAVGLGYNFTHFSDDLLADPNDDQHGVFLRVTGRY